MHFATQRDLGSNLSPTTHEFYNLDRHLTALRLRIFISQQEIRKGRGQWGEGFSGTTIKDTWTKPRARVEARGGGGFGWGGGGGVKGKCRQL